MLGALRRQWLIVVACTAIGVIVAGVYLLVREQPTPEPDRFAVTTQLLVPSRSEDAEIPVTEDVPRVLLRGIASLANSGEVRQDALRAAGIDPSSTAINFDGTVDDEGRVTLRVVAPEPEIALRLAETYTAAFVDARKAIFVQDQNAEREALDARIDTLRARYRAVVAELRVKYPGVADLRLYNESPDRQDDEPFGSKPSFADMPRQAAALVWERAALEEALAEDQARFATLSVSSRAPTSYTEFLDRSGVTPVGGSVPVSESALPPVGVALGAVLLGVVLAVARDRFDRTIRSEREASDVLTAPVLATVPADGAPLHGVAFLDDPRSPVGQAYRALAATAIATDRLPSAVLVTSPTGTRHGEVAANFAAALADLGVRVALVATVPDQARYLEDFEVPEERLSFTDMLAAAHDGRLNGQVRSRLARRPDAPNLVAVPPPGEGEEVELSLDGLAPMLARLKESGIDTTVIAGPSLLANADATIMAWTTRAVLWAIEAGEIRKDDAAAAAANLQLTGVEPFGIAVLGGD